MAKKKILVACGSGIATSTVVANKVKELLNSKGVDAHIQQCKAAEVPSLIDGFDLLVTTTPIGDVGNVPVVRTISFISGIGIEKDIELIIEKLGLEK
ncbi:PTS sugar transporter subunit IIB [Anaerosalibacter massiliensis]|uniref:PTS sugar transporter subunit IIB n=1 Tax=Anaerosalibacter massiliensis TaxID=1347392 RepID=A0A9X2ML47_9FIRM|nr:PTS sugar transporter subunit IIB [Anaerosalibacter massiliensis]MCR2045147.1 PTS sugar transporter subunit IIB [Anaerosalibacter massiliensis]